MIGKGNQYEPGAHIGGAGAVHALKSGHGAVLYFCYRPPHGSFLTSRII